MTRFYRCNIITITVLTLLAGATRAGAASMQWEFSKLYMYDMDLPMNLVEEVEEETDGYILYYIEYDSRNDKRIPGYVSIPKHGEGPFPAVLMMPGYGGSKRMIFQGIDMLSENGYAALCIDPEYHGDRQVPGKELYSKLSYSSRDGMIQTVIDYMRAVDYLGARSDIDMERIGFVGGSMGGIIGAVQAAVDTRIRATALAVGGADWGYLLKHSIVADFLGLERGENRVSADTFRKVVAPADPIHWAQTISPRPVLMLNSIHDILVNPGSNKLLFARLRPPKIIVWFDDDHDIDTDLAFSYIGEFFDSYLKGDEDPAEIGVQVKGHGISPLDMERDTPLPEPLSEMPLRYLFEYEEFLPLYRADVPPVEPGPGKTDVRFLSTHDRIVTGTVSMNESPSSKGAVVYVHRVGGSKDDAPELEKAALDNGYAFLAIDLVYHGDRLVEGRSFISEFPVTSADAMLQTVFDIRRAVDFSAEMLSGNIKSADIIVASEGSLSSKLAIIASAADKRIDEVMAFEVEDSSEKALAESFEALDRSGGLEIFEELTAWADPDVLPSPAAVYTLGDCDRELYMLPENAVSIDKMDDIF